MSRLFFCLLTVALLVACTNNAAEEGEQNLMGLIKSWEAQNERTPNTENSQKLLGLYNQYIEANPDDTENNARFQYRAASLNYRMNQFAPAAKLLEESIRKNYASPNTPNSIMLLASIYKENFRNPTVANIIYQAFVAAFPNDESTPKAQSYLATDILPVEDNLNSLGQNLYNNENGQINFQSANNFITATEQYAMILPKSEKSPEFLYTASQVAGSIRAFSQAINIYDWILEKYPNSDKAAKALFLKAFTLDNELRKYDEAKPIYEAFLSKYPNDEFAESAQFSLDNLGKPIEEIIKNFPETTAQ